MKCWTVTVEKDNNGDLILPIPEELMEDMGWVVGDTLWYDIESNGEVVIRKTKNESSEQERSVIEDKV